MHIIFLSVLKQFFCAFHPEFRHLIRCHWCQWSDSLDFEMIAPSVPININWNILIHTIVMQIHFFSLQKVVRDLRRNCNGSKVFLTMLKILMS